MKIKKALLVFLLSLLVLFNACRKDDEVITPGETGVQPGDTTVSNGFYLLNEGNMGSNKASLDFFDYTTGIYKRNIYAFANPTVVKELGDVGNDINAYGSKLYAVINMSNKVEVLQARTAKRIGQIDIPNCRYVCFSNGHAYISSYAGFVGDPNSPKGFIAEIDTATLQITRKVTVGYQPEEMAIVNGKLYVANSGGYRFPDYDRTVSVVDLSTFTEIKQIDVAINLHRLKADNYGNIWVTSRGDYYDIPSNVYIINTHTDTVKDSLGIAASNICIRGDSAYAYSVEWSYNSNSNKITYALLDIKTQQVISENFITDGTEKQIAIPYGLAVNPLNGDIYITDAKDYVTPGTLYCFDKYGKKKWSVTTGDIPAHFALIN